MRRQSMKEQLPPYFLISKPMIFFRANVSSQALVTPSRLKLRPDNLSGVKTIYGTLETPGTCHQGALYDRCRLNSGRKGYDGRKVANRLETAIRLDSEGLLVNQRGRSL
jgi:hypothetical protein